MRDLIRTVRGLLGDVPVTIIVGFLVLVIGLAMNAPFIAWRFIQRRAHGRDFIDQDDMDKTWD